MASWCVANTIDAAYPRVPLARASPYWPFWASTHYAVTLPLTAMAEMALIFLSLLYVADNLWYEIFKALLAYIPRRILGCGQCCCGAIAPLRDARGKAARLPRRSIRGVATRSLGCSSHLTT